MLNGTGVHDVEIAGLGEGGDDLDSDHHLVAFTGGGHAVDGAHQGRDVDAYASPVLRQLLDGLVLRHLEDDVLVVLEEVVKSEVHAVYFYSQVKNN